VKVSEVMTREVATVGPDETARAAARFMLSEDAGSMPVTSGGKLLGIVTDRDIAVRGVAKGHGPETPVSELMSGDVICAHLDDNVDDVATKMSHAQVRRLPVIDHEGRLCGIVSLGDLAREADEETSEQALEGVSAPGGKHRQG
jgi:CBS domain-containing protein